MHQSKNIKLSEFDFDDLPLKYKIAIRRYANMKNTNDTVNKIIRVLKLDTKSFLDLIVDYNKTNVFPKSGNHENDINNIYYIKSSKNMSFENQIPKRTVRDLLTQEEVSTIQNLRGYPLIAMCKKENQDQFCGYFPLNAGVKEDLIPHRLEDHSLDILKDFCTGG